MPAATPIRIPLVPIVAIAVAVLLHVPPEVALDSAIAEPTHTFPGPDIAAMVGNGFTVTVAVTNEAQPKLLV